MIREHQYRSDYYGGPCTYRWHLIPCGRPRDHHAEVDYITKNYDLAQAAEGLDNSEGNIPA